MKTYTCPDCRKEWPENYCPECAHTIERPDDLDDVIIDGDIVNGTFATCAAQIRLSPFRYIWLKDETRLLAQLWLGLAAIVAFALSMHWWIAAGVLLVLIAPLTYMLWWVVRQVSVIYQNALLTAGMVVSEEPLEFISLSNMDAGSGVPIYAVKRVRISRLPCHPEEVGTLFPCVSGFQDGPDPDRWGDFNPQPLSFGTGDCELIQQRRDKLGEEAFEELKRAFKKGQYPRQTRELFWLPGAGDGKSPPPLPKVS